MKRNKYNKFGNTWTEVDGIKFQSKKEAKRYQELKLLEKAGEIKELARQPIFKFQELKYDSSRTPQYRGDFRYIRDGKVVIEDVKSKATITLLYKLKKALVKYFYNIDITEV